MKTFAGTFNSREAAERAVQRVHTLGIRNDRIAVLTPDMNRSEVEGKVLTTDTEAPGEGRALGGVVGGVIGVAGGSSLAAAAASLIIPGVGPVIAAGLLGAAILGAGGTAAGMAVGEAIDQSLLEGLPHDELFVYEHSLRHGKSVVIVFAEDDELSDQIKTAMEESGAESIDQARESWWQELRAAQEASYVSTGRDFRNDEVMYRRGFEAALDPRVRGTEYKSALPRLNKLYGSSCNDEVFRSGYKQGFVYQENVTNKG